MFLVLVRNGGESMDEFLMKPKIDFAFKEIMENSEARTGFLAAVLNVNPEDIKETRILNPYLDRKSVV